MDLDINIEWRKSDRGEILYDIPYMWNLQNRKRSTDLENALMVGRERNGEKG